MKTFTTLLTEMQTLAQASASSAVSRVNDKASELHKHLADSGVRMHKKVTKTKSGDAPAFIHVHKDDVDKAHSALKKLGYSHNTDSTDHHYTSTAASHKGQLKHHVFTPKEVGAHSFHDGHHVIGVKQQ